MRFMGHILSQEFLGNSIITGHTEIKGSEIMTNSIYETSFTIIKKYIQKHILVSGFEK